MALCRHKGGEAHLATTRFKWANDQFGTDLTGSWRWLAAYVLMLALGLFGDFTSCDLGPLTPFWAQVVPQLHYIAILVAAIRFGLTGGIAAACIAGVTHLTMLAMTCGTVTSQGGHLAMFAAVGLMAGWLRERRAPALVEGPRLTTNGTSEQDRDFARSHLGYLTPELVHQFLTPIASIEGAGFVLEDSDLSDDKRREFVGIIRKECRRLERLIELLDVTQSHSLEYQDVDIVRLLDEAIRLCRPKPEVRVTVRNTQGQNAFRIHCKPELIKHAVQVLTTIAMEAISQNGQVELSGDHDIRENVIRVYARADHAGAQFDPAMLYNRNAADLAVAQLILNRQGGMVRAELPPGGISFSMVLPR